MIHGDLSIVTEPTAELLSMEQARSQCRVTSDDHDERLEVLLAASRTHVESFTRRQLVPATWDIKLPCFPGCASFELPKPPLRSVTWIKYYDAAGDLQTWDSAKYLVHAYAGEHAMPGKVELVYGQNYPWTYQRSDAVTIRFVAGYASADDVPKALQQAARIYLEEMFGNGGQATRGVSVVPNSMTAEALMWPFRVH